MSLVILCSLVRYAVNVLEPLGCKWGGFHSLFPVAFAWCHQLQGSSFCRLFYCFIESTYQPELSRLSFAGYFSFLLLNVKAPPAISVHLTSCVCVGELLVSMAFCPRVATDQTPPDCRWGHGGPTGSRSELMLLLDILRSPREVSLVFFPRAHECVIFLFPYSICMAWHEECAWTVVLGPLIWRKMF